MNEKEKQQLKVLLVATASYYGQVIDDNALKLHVEDLADLAYPEVYSAIGKLRRDPNTTKCPRPAQIRQLISPTRSDENVAREVSARIYTAICKFGHPNPDRAREYIGTLGWEVVKLQGGWDEVCRTTGEDNPIGVAQSQWFKIAITLQEKSRAGTLDQKPELPNGVSGFDAGKLLKQMPSED